MTREQARELLDAVPDDRLEAAVAALEPFVDPMLTMLLIAPEDEEGLSDEDLAAIGEGEADIAHGNVVSHEDVKRRFGIS
jgi:predicted transcriptional regulator